MAKNRLIEVGKFTFPADFVILEMEEDNKVPLIIGRPFLYTANAVIQVKQKQLNLKVKTEQMIFNIDYVIKHTYSNDDTCFSIDVIDDILEEDFDAVLDEGSKILHSIEGTLLQEEMFSEFDEFMAMTTDENSESESDTKEPPFEKITINSDYKIKTPLEEPPTDLELKPLPDNLEYVFLEEPSFLPVIISFKYSTQNKSKVVSVLKKHKEAFAWKTIDILGICPSFCKHKIQLLEDKKPVVQKQRSPWVSPIHCVPKKGGITVVTNENDELVRTRIVTGWRECIDYRKLNEATIQDHFPLPFMDQMRMPFGLCNPPATLQRCMLAIFYDMIEESIKEKCHFMVKEGIVLGHKVSGAGPEVDKVKINVILKLQPHTNVKRNLSFELMYDASDFAVGAVLGQKDADHLSRIENDKSSDDSEVDDNFLGEILIEINTRSEPRFAKFANYLVADIIPKGMTYQQKNKSSLTSNTTFGKNPTSSKYVLMLRWPPRVTLGRLLPHARGFGFKPRHGGFPLGAKKEWGLSPKAKVRVLHTAQLDVTVSSNH
nr:DNA-directed DNA polymerase [Tanacetum cinerariifolium]